MMIPDGSWSSWQPQEILPFRNPQQIPTSQINPFRNPQQSPPLYQTGPYIAPFPAPMTPPATQIDPTTGMPMGGGVDPTTGMPAGTSAGVSPAPTDILGGLTSATIFGIPILYIAIGIGAYFLLKKR